MDLTPEQRLDLLKVEMHLIQAVFDKYDDMVFRSRNWFVTLWMATLGLGFTARVPAFILTAGLLAAFYWLLEGMIRHQYWYKYVVRYRAVRDELNRVPANVEGLSVFDLTHHYGKQRPSEWKRLWHSFAKVEPFVLYLALGMTAVILWWLGVGGVVSLSPSSGGGI
jgi:hypothetical protein